MFCVSIPDEDGYQESVGDDTGIDSAIKVSCFQFSLWTMNHVKRLIYSEFRFASYFCIRTL